MSSSKVETEAKFLVPDEATFAALQQLSHLADFELKSSGVKVVVDRYLDTAERTLFRAGLACRLRNLQTQQLVTLKALTPATGAIHRRQEIEMTVENSKFQAEQPRTWAKNELQKRVVELVGPASLQTLFVLYQTRHQFQALRQGGAVIEFSLDEVSLHEPAVVDYYELEAELIETGNETDLAHFVTALQSEWLLPVETQNKFERALAATSGADEVNLPDNWTLSEQEEITLAYIAAGADEIWAKRALIILMSKSRQLSQAEIAGEAGTSNRSVQYWQKAFAQKRLDLFPPQVLAGYQAINPIDLPIKQTKSDKATEKIGLKSSDSLAEAGRKILGYHFSRMLKHEPGTRQGNDIEALHDMRVATRRMRAAFRVFERGYTKKAIKPLLVGLRATGRALGQVRDLDVFMETLQTYQSTFPAKGQSGLQPLLEAWSNEREQARQEMLVYLDSREYRKFKRGFRHFIKTEGLGAKPLPAGVPIPYQLRHVASSLIYERYEAVRAFEVVLENASIDMLHQLRIAFKQLRYTLEYFEEILGAEREWVIQEVKILQDHLGALNDADVASILLRDFLVKWDESQLHRPLALRSSPVHLVTYLNTRLAERQQLIISFPAAWARFNHPDFRRNLALAVAAL